MAKTQKQTYRLWTYDLWSDGEGGLIVNNRFDSDTITIRVKGTVHNAGTEHEFTSFHPGDRQLNRAVNGQGLRWSGESEYTLYASDKNGDPVCELVREESTMTTNETYLEVVRLVNEERKSQEDTAQLNAVAEELHDLVYEAVHSWPEYDNEDCPINGGDMVEWFGEWRRKALESLAKVTNAPYA